MRRRPAIPLTGVLLLPALLALAQACGLLVGVEDRFPFEDGGDATLDDATGSRDSAAHEDGALDASSGDALDAAPDGDAGDGAADANDADAAPCSTDGSLCSSGTYVMCEDFTCGWRSSLSLGIGATYALTSTGSPATGGAAAPSLNLATRAFDAGYSSAYVYVPQDGANIPSKVRSGRVSFMFRVEGTPSDVPPARTPFFGLDLQDAELYRIQLLITQAGVLSLIEYDSVGNPLGFHYLQDRPLFIDSAIFDAGNNALPFGRWVKVEIVFTTPDGGVTSSVSVFLDGQPLKFNSTSGPTTPTLARRASGTPKVNVGLFSVRAPSGAWSVNVDGITFNGN